MILIGSIIHGKQKLISIEHNIEERKEIISKYQTYHILDRVDAIKKRKELRVTVTDVAEVTSANLLVQ